MCNIRTSRAAATCAFVVGAIAIGTTGVLAHSGASGIVRERMDAMIALSDHMKAVGVMLKGEAELDRNIVEISASQIVRLSDDLPGMFPESSVSGPSEARDAIWIQWDRFLGLTDNLRQAAAVLEAVAASGDDRAIAEAFREAGKTRGGCHEAFRR